MKNIFRTIITVAALALAGFGCTTEVQYDPSRLFRPVNIVVNATENSVTATWAGIQGSVGYNVELYIGETVKIDGKNYVNRYLVASEENHQGTAWTVNGLEFNKTYWFRVKANCEEATYSSRFSNFFSVKTPLENQVITVTVLDVDLGKVQVNWQGGFELTYFTLSGPDGESQIDIMAGNDEGSMILDGLGAGDYTVKVYNSQRAFNTFAFRIPILKDVLKSEITFETITLRWADAANLDHITLVNVADETDSHIYNISAISNFTLVVPASALRAFATYEATIYFEDNSAGNSVRFTTKDAAPAGLIIVNDADELKAALLSASNGSTIGLNAGTYNIVDSSNALMALQITKGVTITAASSETPLINAKSIELRNTGAVDLIRIENIKFDGGNNGSYFVDVTTASTADIQRLEMVGCEISGIANCVVRADRNTATTVGVMNMLLDDCIIYSLNGSNGGVISTATGTPIKCETSTITVTNCTITNFGHTAAGNRLFPLTGNPSLVFTVANNTIIINSATNPTINYRGTIGAGNGTAVIKDNIFYCLNRTTTLYARTPDFGANPITFAISGNCIPVAFAAGVSGTSLIDDTFWSNYSTSTEDPQFVSIATDNYTLGNKTLIDARVGDPRWIPVSE